MLRKAGKKVFFVTNNSRMDRDRFSSKLHAMGLGEFASDEAMHSSVTATARYFADQQPTAASKAFVIGGHGLKEAVRSAGVELVKPELTSEERGFGPEEVAKVELDPAVRAVVVGFDIGFC